MSDNKYEIKPNRKTSLKSPSREEANRRREGRIEEWGGGGKRKEKKQKTTKFSNFLK